MNNYDCRIDNRAFDYLLRKPSNEKASTEVKKGSKYAAEDNDPFSDFSSVAASSVSQETSKN